MTLIVIIVERVIELYMLLIFIWALGSWFPGWRYQPWFKLIEEFVWPYISLFRSLPLRSAGLDFTPTVAIIVLYAFRRLVEMAAVGR